MSQVKDPVNESVQRGSKESGGAFGPSPEGIVCDAAIKGSGAGAGITAKLVTKAGLQVVMIEEGPLKIISDFNEKESEAYPSLDQKGAVHQTADKAINIHCHSRCA